MRLAYAVLVTLLIALASGCATVSGEAPGPQAPVAAASAGMRPASEPSFADRLERAGVPLDLPDDGKAILVNIPAFELIAFEDAEPVFESRVIVGTPDNPTPVLATTTAAVRFRPTWRPTPAMIASGEYEDRVWPPGENNPLGLAAIRFESGILVYLHDTNRPALFDQERRALSHGCVRVERWRELVAWVLDMPSAEVDRLARGGRTVDVPTPPIPVRIVYLPRVPDGAGGVEYHADIYGLGEAVPTVAGTGAACAGTAIEGELGDAAG
jgi:murein L,D-transpeptidase YcbB/YkuD